MKKRLCFALVMVAFTSAWYGTSVSAGAVSPSTAYGFSCVQGTSITMPFTPKFTKPSLDMKCFVKAPPLSASSGLRSAFDNFLTSIHSGGWATGTIDWQVLTTSGGSFSLSGQSASVRTVAARGDFTLSTGTVLSKGAYTGPDNYFHLVIESNLCGACGTTADVRWLKVNLPGSGASGWTSLQNTSGDFHGMGAVEGSSGTPGTTTWPRQVSHYGAGSIDATNWLTFSGLQPDYFGSIDPFADTLCETTTVAVAMKPFGTSTFNTIASPGGQMAGRGDTIRLTIDRAAAIPVGEGPITVSMRWQPETSVLGRFTVLGDVTTFPTVFTIEHPGPPSDLGSMELRCRAPGDDDRYWTGAEEWGDTIQQVRPCANMEWNFDYLPDVIGLGASQYVSFGFPAANGDAVVEGLYLDRDGVNEDGVTINYLHAIERDTEGTFLAAVSDIFEYGQTSGTPKHEFFDPVSGDPFDSGSFDGYDPPEGSVDKGYFTFELENVPIEKATMGVWCFDSTSDVGVLYQFDSSYVAFDVDDPDDDSEEGCYDQAGMKLTSPKTWVRGIGRMTVCLVEWLFVPDSDELGESFDEFKGALEEQVPFSFAFLLVDFASELGGELSDPSGTGCFDMPTSFSFGSFSTSLSDVCIGEGLDPTIGQRQLLAALMIAPLLWAVCLHALRMVAPGTRGNDE